MAMFGTLVLEDMTQSDTGTAARNLKLGDYVLTPAGNVGIVIGTHKEKAIVEFPTLESESMVAMELLTVIPPGDLPSSGRR